MIDDAYRATARGRLADIRAGVMGVLDALMRGKPPERVAFTENFKIYNATSIGDIRPRGTLFVTDVGTTPSRSVALIYSDGKVHVELAAKVI